MRLALPAVGLLAPYELRLARLARLRPLELPLPSLACFPQCEYSMHLALPAVVEDLLPLPVG